MWYWYWLQFKHDHNKLHDTVWPQRCCEVIVGTKLVHLDSVSKLLRYWEILNSASRWHTCFYQIDCSTRVSNELGAGNAMAAKLAVHVVMSMSAFQATIIGSILVALRFHWGWMYSNEAEVVHHVGTIMPFIACIALFDGIQGVLSGKREHITPVTTTVFDLQPWGLRSQGNSLVQLVLIPILWMFRCCKRLRKAEVGCVDQLIYVLHNWSSNCFSTRISFQHGWSSEIFLYPVPA